MVKSEAQREFGSFVERMRELAKVKVKPTD
jgi:hypothetical protein